MHVCIQLARSLTYAMLGSPDKYKQASLVQELLGKTILMLTMETLSLLNNFSVSGGFETQCFSFSRKCFEG